MYRAVYRRDKLLEELRKKDYERYTYVKDQLQINWEPPSLKLERRSSSYGLFKMETKAKARQDRQDKMEELKKLYDIQKAKFFVEKAKILKEIGNEIRDLGYTDFSLDLNNTEADNQVKIKNASSF